MSALQSCSLPNLYLREGDRLFDASLLIGSDGGLQGVSKMVHIAQSPGFYEQSYYTPSDTGFRVYDTPLGSIGIVVCFDRHFPESIRETTISAAPAPGHVCVITAKVNARRLASSTDF